MVRIKVKTRREEGNLERVRRELKIIRLIRVSFEKVMKFTLR